MKYKLIICLIAFIVFIAILQPVVIKSITDNQNDEIMMYIVSYTLAIVSVLLFCKIFSDNQKYIENQKEIEFLKKKEIIIYEYYKSIANKNKNINSIKEEIVCELNKIKEMTKESKISELDENIMKVNKQIEKIGEKNYTNNSIVNAIFSIKEAVLKQNNIKTSILVENDINFIKIEEIDICNILTNLFDNAIEACEKNNSESSFVEVKIGKKAGQIVIKFCNSYNGELEASYKTTKTDKENHGNGLKIIKQITEKYKGQIDICAENNRFEVLILLPA